MSEYYDAKITKNKIGNTICTVEIRSENKELFDKLVYEVRKELDL